MAEELTLAQGAAMSVAVEAFARMELEHKLAAAKRVAEEAIRLLSPEQVAVLRKRLDALEVGDSGDASNRDI